MPYRTPPPDDRAHIVDLARHSEIVVDNGTISRISIPCNYVNGMHVVDPRRHRMAHDHWGWPDPDHPDMSCQLPPMRRGCHVTLEPIDLEGEGYEYVDVGLVEPPDGLSFEGQIGYGSVELLVVTHCPDAQTRDWHVPFAVYAGGSTVDDDGNDYELRDVVTKGVLHIVRGPYEVVSPDPDPSPDPTPPVPPGSIGTDELADKSVTRDKLSDDLIADIDSTVGNDDIEDNAVSWDKLDSNTRNQIADVKTKIEHPSSYGTAKLEVGHTGSSSTLKLDGIGIYITKGQVWQSQSGIAAHSYRDFNVSFGHTYPSKPTVVVGLYSTSEDDEIGKTAVVMKENRVDGFTARIFNNDDYQRQPGFTWVAIG